eukprot:gene18996-25580_t
MLVILAIVAIAAAAIYLLIQKQSHSYSQHVDQLKPKAKKVREFKIYTTEDVAQHNKRDDAWIIVKDKSTGEERVYDITDYVDEHPGGESILNNIGGDSTEGFHGPQHPATVFVMVEEWIFPIKKRGTLHSHRPATSLANCVHLSQESEGVRNPAD